MPARPKRSRREPNRTTSESGDTPDGGPVRLNRFIARAGVCSRRKADEHIAAGHVKVNGNVVQQLGTLVQPTDEIELGGRLLTPRKQSYYLMNKPVDTISTTSDERDRRTVIDLLAGVPTDGLYPVGRLDRNTTGVLIVTNDGELTNRLMHPRYTVDKVYLVTTRRPVRQPEVAALLDGVHLDDGLARAVHATSPVSGRADCVAVMLHEGRNRQVRRMMEAIGHEVRKLERVSYAGLRCDDLRPGKWRRLTENEVRKLRRLVGLKA